MSALADLLLCAVSQVRPSSAHNSPYWTTNSGAPVWNNNSSSTVGSRGGHPGFVSGAVRGLLCGQLRCCSKFALSLAVALHERCSVPGKPCDSVRGLLTCRSRAAGGLPAHREDCSGLSYLAHGVPLLTGSLQRQRLIHCLTGNLCPV